MRWPDVRNAYPDRRLVIEALEAHAAENHRIRDRIAVIETCTDGTTARQCYNELHRLHPQREFYFVHTSRELLDIWRADRSAREGAIHSGLLCSRTDQGWLLATLNLAQTDHQA